METPIELYVRTETARREFMLRAGDPTLVSELKEMVVFLQEVVDCRGFYGGITHAWLHMNNPSVTW